MTLEQILIQGYRKTQDNKKKIIEACKKLTVQQIVTKDLAREKLKAEREYANKKIETYDGMIQSIETRMGNINLDNEITQEEVLKDIRIPEYENQIRSLNESLDNAYAQLKVIKTELDETTYLAKSSYEEWNYRKNAFGTAKMEEIYAKEKKETDTTQLISLQR